MRVVRRSYTLCDVKSEVNLITIYHNAYYLYKLLSS